jgi:polyhydroxybutyrate depolymerase
MNTATTDPSPASLRTRRWKWPLRIFVALALVTALLAVAACREIYRSNGEVLSSGRKRSYLLHVPKTYQPNRPTALVICLHGFSEWPAHVMRLSHWNQLADEDGFLVVYPRGSRFPLRWNCGGRFSQQEQAQQDVQFISDLIDQLKKEYNLDETRIYANGLSNGGGMSFLLAGQLSGRIAAIGSVGGAYALPWADYHPKRPVAAIIFHGTADPIVPYHGKTWGTSGFSLPDIPQWVETLAARNGCQTNSVPLPANSSVSGIYYPGDPNHADVVFYTVAEGGHTWPGGKKMVPIIVGKTTADVDATRLMWKFFQEHPMGK